MDFAFFEELTEAEAQEFLEQYLKIESEEIKKTLVLASDAGVVADYSLESITPLFLWLLDQVVTVPLKPDRKLPRWLRKDHSYTSSLFEFDDRSTSLVLRAGYYLGTSFVQTFPQLRWATGSEDIAQCHQPVVAGFSTGREMATMLVSENLFSRAMRTGEAEEHIQKAVDTWAGYV